MSAKHHRSINLSEEVERFFEPSSLCPAQAPRFVLILGAVATGKTTLRRNHYAQGFVVIDAAEIFLNLSQGTFFPFPAAFQVSMQVIGRRVALQALQERRHIVMELIGADSGKVASLIEAMDTAGYQVEVQVVQCDLEQAIQRNLNREEDAISAYYAEPFQRAWLMEAAAGVAPMAR